MLIHRFKKVPSWWYGLNCESLTDDEITYLKKRDYFSDEIWYWAATCGEKRILHMISRKGWEFAIYKMNTNDLHGTRTTNVIFRWYELNEFLEMLHEERLRDYIPLWDGCYTEEEIKKLEIIFKNSIK